MTDYRADKPENLMQPRFADNLAINLFATSLPKLGRESPNAPWSAFKHKPLRIRQINSSNWMLTKEGGGVVVSRGLYLSQRGCVYRRSLYLGD